MQDKSLLSFCRGLLGTHSVRHCAKCQGHCSGRDPVPTYLETIAYKLGAPQSIHDSLSPSLSPPPRPHLLSPILALVNFHGPQLSCLQSMRQNDEYKAEFTSATSQDMLITFGLLLDNGLQKDTMLSPGPAPGGALRQVTCPL